MKPLVLGAERISNAFYLAHASAAAYEDAPEDYASFAALQLAQAHRRGRYTFSRNRARARPKGL